MNGASYSSWQAAGELPDRDDDEPYAGFEAFEIPEAPGVYSVWFRSGWGRTTGRSRRIRTGLSCNLATAIASDLDSRYQERLYQRLKAMAEDEDRQAADAEAALDANRVAMDAADAEIVAEMMKDHRCAWCGAMVPIGVSVCGPCLATYPELDDDSPPLSDAIPW